MISQIGTTSVKHGARSARGDETERLIRVQVFIGLPDAPATDVTRKRDETKERHARRPAMDASLTLV
jgi:hypothetical protein